MNPTGSSWLDINATALSPFKYIPFVGVRLHLKELSISLCQGSPVLVI